MSGCFPPSPHLVSPPRRLASFFLPGLALFGFADTLLTSASCSSHFSSFDKITARIAKLCYGLDADFVEPVA